MQYSMILIAILGASTVACSHRAVYESVQHNNQFDCQKQPVSQQEECERQASKSYEQYERERQELLKKKD